MPEARTAQRFPLKLQVKVKDPQHGSQQGVTGNLSAAGVYIRMHKSWKIGSEVEFDITLPAEAVQGDTDVQVRCRGRVVRVERQDGDTGVACVIEKYQFVREGEPSC